MKVVLVPGPRNEELINRIKQIKTTHPDTALNYSYFFPSFLS